jgi:transcriptional regulator with XRE-family HTH domain
VNNIAKNLINQRGEMSQTDLARQSGVSQKTISAIELGRIKFPTYQTAFKLSNVLGCEVDLFLDNKLQSIITEAAKVEKEPEVKLKKETSSKLAALKNKLK